MGLAIGQAIFPQLPYRGAIRHDEQRMYLGGYHFLVWIYKIALQEYSWSGFNCNGTGIEPLDATIEGHNGVESLVLLQRAFKCGSKGPNTLYKDMAHRGLTSETQ